ncbi:MAG: hypothetical protein VX223_08455 [Myxococcota bacterium]|nr:hypothetical protein [Myxococcota bacterium]
MTEPDERPIEERLEDLLNADSEGVVAEILRRALKTGRKTVHTVRSGPGTVRNLANDILSNEKVEAMGTTLSSVREELVKVFGREFSGYLDRLNVVDVLVGVLTSISLEVKTELRFIPNDKRLVKPNIKNSVKVKTTEAEETPSEEH